MIFIISSVILFLKVNANLVWYYKHQPWPIGAFMIGFVQFEDPWLFLETPFLYIYSGIGN